ncbi:MAG: ABC transporter six-transmembrane domain-containing protein, partial [Kordiimonas sp.]
MQAISHLSILKKYKGRISVTFFILVLENLLQILEPLVLGFAINGLTTGSW